MTICLVFALLPATRACFVRSCHKQRMAAVGNLNDFVKYQMAKGMEAPGGGGPAGMASELADKGAEMASAASDQVKSFGSEIENMARRNPIGVLAAAVVIGVLIGLMGRRS